MPVCPECKAEYPKRKNGACPGCQTRVDAYLGQWFRAEIGSPTTAVLRHFECRVSDALSVGRYRSVVFHIPEKSARYKRELVTAERFLNEADWDFDLVIEALDVLFTHKSFSWRTRDSLIGASREFTTALAIAKSDREQKTIVISKDVSAFEAVMQKENIFA